MPVDDRAFAARAVAITEASRGRVDRLQRELAEQQAGARARGRGHLQRMRELGLHDRSWDEVPTATATPMPTSAATPTPTRARDTLGDDEESFSDRNWLH